MGSDESFHRHADGRYGGRDLAARAPADLYLRCRRPIRAPAEDRFAASRCCKVDRGGQVTYHGPGQLVAYVLMDLHRHGFTVRSLVRALEQAVIDLTLDFGISASRRDDAPGRVCPWRQDRRIGTADSPRLQLPRLELEREDGPRTVPRYRSMRSRGTGSDSVARSGCRKPRSKTSASGWSPS